MAVGVAGSEVKADQVAQFRKLLQLLQVDYPTAHGAHQAWVHTATRWAEIVALRWSLPKHPPTEDVDSFRAAHRLIEQNFQDWMTSHYGSLPSSLSDLRPKREQNGALFLRIDGGWNKPKSGS